MSKIKKIDLDATMYVLAETGRNNRVDRIGVWFPIHYSKLAYQLSTYSGKVKEILNILMINKRIEIKDEGAYKKYCKLLDTDIPDEEWFASYISSLHSHGKTVNSYDAIIASRDLEVANKNNGVWTPSSRMFRRCSGSGSTYELPTNNTLSVHDSFRLARKTTDYKTVRERQKLD